MTCPRNPFLSGRQPHTDDGSTGLSISYDVAERFRVSGWHGMWSKWMITVPLEAACADSRPSILRVTR
jgi:hypothetical protein